MIEMDKIIKILLIASVMTITALGQKQRAKQYQGFDPLILNEPFLPMGDGTMIKEIITDVDKATTVREDTTQFVSKMGWRIQALTTEDMFVADSVEKELRKEFGQQAVKKIYNSPYWKIRVGNCDTRYEAEELLNKVEGMGYNRAWIIRSKVRVKEKTFPQAR